MSHVLLLECDFANEQWILQDKTGVKGMDWGKVITGLGKMKFLDLLTVKSEVRDWFYVSTENCLLLLFSC